MKKGNQKRKNRKYLIMIMFIILITTITVGYTNQEGFLYQYNMSKIRSAECISERIRYSARAIKHCKTQEEVRRIEKLLRENI